MEYPAACGIFVSFDVYNKFPIQRVLGRKGEGINTTTGYLCSVKKMLVCEAHAARTQNTTGVIADTLSTLRNTRHDSLGCSALCVEELNAVGAALSDREQLVRAHTVRFAHGFAPCGGGAQLRR